MLAVGCCPLVWNPLGANAQRDKETGGEEEEDKVCKAAASDHDSGVSVCS